MACCDNDIVCGTGGWNGPQPGDPDNNIYINALGTYGGNEVSWTYPSLNAFAIAHVILYRGETPIFTEAVEKVRLSSNVYFDRIPDDQIRRYYYWVQLVSIHGTVLDPIGPATATPLRNRDRTLEELTQEIDESLLAQSLRDRIDRLDVIDRNVAQEILDRIASNESLAAALAAVHSETGEALTFVRNEIIERRDADQALVQSINVLAAGLEENAAAILEEKTVRVTETESLAEQVGILVSETGENAAAILTEQQTRTTQNAATAAQVNSLAVQAAANNAAIVNEVSARATAVDSLTTTTNSLVSKTNNNAAAIQAEATARTNADTALGNQIVTVQSSLGGQLASVQTNMNTSVNSMTNQINAMWTAKVDVNGLVGGFGLGNNGQVVDAGFDVDRFWVGRTVNRVKPFIIDNDTVYINKARIRDADIDTLKIAGNAVTIPIFVEAAPSVAHPSNSGPVNSISFAASFNSTTPVLLLVAMTASNNGPATNATVSAYVDDSFIAQRTYSITGGWATSIVSTFATVVSGNSVNPTSHTFTIKCGNNWPSGGPWYDSYISVTLLGFKR